MTIPEYSVMCAEINALRVDGKLIVRFEKGITFPPAKTRHTVEFSEARRNEDTMRDQAPRRVVTLAADSAEELLVTIQNIFNEKEARPTHE